MTVQKLGGQYLHCITHVCVRCSTTICDLLYVIVGTTWLPTTCLDRPRRSTSGTRLPKSRIDDDDGQPTITTHFLSTSSQWCTARSATSLSKRQTSTDTWTPSASPSSTNPLRRQHRPNQRPRASSLHQLRKDPPASRTRSLDHRRSSMAPAALSKLSPRGLLRRCLSRPSLGMAPNELLQMRMVTLVHKSKRLLPVLLRKKQKIAMRR